MIVQFSKPGYTAEFLRELNEISKVFGREFEIRFFGHYYSLFDISILRYIPDAPSVSIDCLTKAKNLEALSTLRNLKELCLGIFEMDVPDVLSKINLQNIESLRLGETRKSNIDLGYLKHFRQ